MAVVLNTEITLDPNNQIAHLADFTDLEVGTEYVITADFIPSNTFFTFLGYFDITLTRPPIGVPQSQTEVPATISTIPAPAIATPPAAYPYALNDRLTAAGLNHAFQLNSGTAPPIGNGGNARQYSEWIDTSVNPAVIRMCAVPTASNGYVASEWVKIAAIDVTNNTYLIDQSQIIVTTPPPGDNDTSIATTAYVQNALTGYLRLTGGTLSGQLNINANLSVSGLYIYQNGSGGTGNISSTGGPLIFADPNNTVLKIGSGNGGFIVQSYAGANVLSVGASGTISALGTITSSSLIHSSLDVTADRNLWVNGPYIYQSGSGGTGAANGAGGPLIFADPNNTVLKIGSGNGGFIVQSYAGAQVLSVGAGGNLNVTSDAFFAGSQVHIGNNGIDYFGNAHQIGFTWDGLVGIYVDRVFEGYIASVGTNGNMSIGGTLSSGAITTSSLQVNGPATFNPGATVHFYDIVYLMTGGLYCVSGTSIYPNSNITCEVGNASLAFAGMCSNTFYAPSDVRNKTDIIPVPAGCLDVVRGIAPQAYRLAVASDDAAVIPPPLNPPSVDLPPPQVSEVQNRLHWGFIAQDVGRVMHEAGYDFGGHIISKNGSEGLSLVDMMAVLWAAVRELSDQVNTLSHGGRVSP